MDIIQETGVIIFRAVTKKGYLWGVGPKMDT